jgi:anti-sigma factor (TIGR02949 family)
MSDECDALLERLEIYLDGECPRDMESQIAAHLQECPPCLDRADFERKVRQLVASRCRDAAPSGLMDAIRARLELS